MVLAAKTKVYFGQLSDMEKSVKKTVYISSPTDKQTAILIDKASLILSHKTKYIILRKL